MPIRNIPEEIVEKLKTLSLLEKRSINSEILIILEKGIQEEIESHTEKSYSISKETQLKIWQKLAGLWQDERTTKEIIDDIIKNRSHGRDIEL